MLKISKEWKESLKVGDTVILSTGRGGKDHYIKTTIKRQTKLYWILEYHAIKIRKSDLQNPGRDYFNFQHIIPYNEENQIRLLRTQVTRKLSTVGEKLYKYSYKIATLADSAKLVELKKVLEKVESLIKEDK